MHARQRLHRSPACRTGIPRGRRAPPRHVTNSDVARYRSLAGQHLVEHATAEAPPEVVLLGARTSQSQIRVEKIVALHTSRDFAIADPASDAVELARDTVDFEELLRAHTMCWGRLWTWFRCGLFASAPAQQAVRLHLPPAGDGVAEQRRIRPRSPGPRPARRSPPGTHLRGRAVHPPGAHAAATAADLFPLLYRYRRLPLARKAASASPSPTACGTTTRPAEMRSSSAPSAPRCSCRSPASSPRSPITTAAETATSSARRWGAAQAPRRAPQRAPGSAQPPPPRDLATPVRTLPRQRAHQPVRRLRAAPRTRLGGLPAPARRHPTPRPHPRSRRRHPQPLQGVRASRCAHALLPAVPRRAPLRTQVLHALGHDSEEHRVLPAAHQPRLNPHCSTELGEAGSSLRYRAQPITITVTGRTVTVRTAAGKKRRPVVCTCGSRTHRLGPGETARFSLEHPGRGTDTTTPP